MTRFENKVKSRKIKHYNIDQTINETLEEAEYENVLDELIKKMAIQNSRASSLRSSLSSSSSSSSTKITVKYVKQLVEERHITMSRRILVSDSLSHNYERDHVKEVTAANFTHVEILDQCGSEFPLLEHAFKLAKRCSFVWDRFRCDEYYSRFAVLANQNTCLIVKSITSWSPSITFLDWFKNK